MGPFAIFASILKLLWPFFKENMLQDGTMKDWLRRNRNTCILFMYQLIMLGVCLYLADMTLRTRALDGQTTAKLTKLQTEHKALDEKYKESERQLKLEMASNARMRIFTVQRCRLFPEPCQFLIEETVRRQEEAGQVATPEQAEETNTMWCGVVKQSDLTNETIREKYVRQCSAQQPATAKP